MTSLVEFSSSSIVLVGSRLTGEFKNFIVVGLLFESHCEAPECAEDDRAIGIQERENEGEMSVHKFDAKPCFICSE